MNKKASKIVLLTTIGLMLACTAILGLNTKEEYGLEDISGSRESLNNVNLVLQDKIGAYRTKEIKISKDKTQVDQFAKARVLRYPFTSFYKENRNFYSDGFGLRYSYEDGSTIGHVSYEYDYDKEGNEKKILSISEKDLDTTKVNNYNLEMDMKKTEDKYVGIQGIPIKYNSELYVLTTDKDEDTELLEKRGNRILGNKKISVNIYKIDLENEVAELVDSKTFKGGDKFIDTGYSLFTHNNKYYIEMYTYEKTTDKKLKRDISYIVYDLEKTKFETIDMTHPQEVSLDTYSDYTREYINGDIANIATYIVEDDEITLNISTLDLKTNKITKENELYTIKAPEKNYSYHIGKMRSVDNKLYIVMDGLEVPDASQGREQFNKRYVYAIDEKSKETLYTGYIKQQPNKFVNFDIVLEEEL